MSGGTKTCATAIALAIIASGSCLAESPAIPVLHVPNPLRLSVAANMVRACAGFPAAAAIQNDSEAQLRDAGRTVSNIYNGRLTFDLDCVPVGQSAARAVHQCLDFAQVLSADPGVAGRTFATTWRQCRSYTCRGTRCGELAHGSAKALIGEFLSASVEREAQAPVAASNAVDRIAAAVPAPSGSNRRSSMRAAFYSLYVLIGCVELVYWARRKKTA